VGDTAHTSAGGLHDVVLRGALVPAFAATTALSQALALDPTFVTLWIGNNDVLAAATSGIVIEGVTLTPAALFEAEYRSLVNALGSRRMALATIPRVTAIPFVTTVAPVVVDPATRRPVLVNGQPVPLLGPDGPLAANDRVLLTAQAELAQGKGIPAALGGSGQPLSNSVVLSAAELQQIQSRADAFNAVIRAVAGEKGAALFDAERIFDRIVAGGYVLGGVRITNAFLTGGLFSFDGVHPTNLGYAIVADEFVQAIDARYGATIPRVNLGRVMRQGGATTAPVSAAQAVAAAFSARAEQNLRDLMGLPPKAELERLAARQGAHPPAQGGANPGIETPLP
jgi:lysophospholipase L1-like esterase